MIQHSPWMEKYRPSSVKDIILSQHNRIIIENIVDQNHFPNLLFFGPPGTGKTTTIMNLIQLYQTKFGGKNRDLIMHLNASDERGIDTIRNQIQTFVCSGPLFSNGMKFVILDEVDCMTKSAQLALRYLIQMPRQSVRYCLVCNYISKIDESLQNEFMQMRFNQLPKDDIIVFLKEIAQKENITLVHSCFVCIVNHFHSDIRSMINYLQSNQHTFQVCQSVMKDSVYDEITKAMTTKNVEVALSLIDKLSEKYELGAKTIIKQYLNYMFYQDKFLNDSCVLNFIETVIHENVMSDAKYARLILSYLSDTNKTNDKINVI